MKEAWKIWSRARKFAIARWIFNYLWRDPLSGMRDIVETSAKQRTVAGIMNWLDDQHILHCVFCPETTQLHNHPMGKMCSKHFDGASREPKVTTA